jgi:hypothetical protein
MRGLLCVIIIFIEVDGELFGEDLKPLGLPLVVNQGYGKALQTECRPDSRYCGVFGFSKILHCERSSLEFAHQTNPFSLN